MTTNERKPGERRLNAREERFAQLVAGGMSQAQAFRIANPAAEKWADSAVHSKASHMMARPHVEARIRELLEQSAKQVVFTLADHLRNLETISKAALKAKDFSAAASAEVARGKASGFYVVKTEVTGKNGGPIETKQTRDLSEDELAAELAKYGIQP